MRRASITAGAYHVVAQIVRTLPVDEATRLIVADHFCKKFHERSPSFDPYAWERATGGMLVRKPKEQDAA